MANASLNTNLGPYIVGNNNTTDLIFTYKAPAAITGNLHVTLQSPAGASFDSNSQPLVVGSDPKQATATFKMTVKSSSGAVTFGAKVNDSANTSMNPSYNGTITDYSLASVELNLTGNFLQVGDETDYVTASTTLLNINNHALQGEDLLIRATGADDTKDAFGKYVDVYLDASGQALDPTQPPFEKVAYGHHSFNVLRLNSDKNGGVKFYLKPSPSLKGGGHVTLLSHLGTQDTELPSGDLFVLSATPTGDNKPSLLSPGIDHLDGIYLKPPQGDVNCMAKFPPALTSNTGYAITNIVNNKTTIVALAKNDDLSVIDHEVHFPFPLAKLTHCANPGHCVSSDFNQISYILFNDEEASYSHAKAFYLDAAVQNDPPDGGGITRNLSIPLLFQAKDDGSQTADTSKPIKPGGPDNGGQWITPDVIKNGLVIRVPYSSAISSTKVNGRLYLTGWDDFETNASGGKGDPKIYNKPLWGQDQTVTSPGRDHFIRRSDLYGYDVNPNPGPDAGLWIEYWDASDTNTRSVKYWNPLNTQPDVN